MMQRNRSSALAIILTGAVLSACGGASQPSPSSPASAPTTGSAIASGGASPSSSATRDPQASLSPSSPPTDVATDFPRDSLVIAVVDGLRVRSSPGLSGSSLGTLRSGYQSLVVAGPEFRDGLEWYLIAGLGLPPASGCATFPGGPDAEFTCPVWWGWSARESEDGSTWLAPVLPPDCAAPDGPLDDFAYQERYRVIPCYGNEPLTLRGWLHVRAEPVPAGTCGYGALDAEDLRWLACPGQLELASSPDVVGMVVAPFPGVSWPPEGGNVVVEGHFDDPEAARCAYGDIPEAAVLTCRATFVVTSLRSDSP